MSNTCEACTAGRLSMSLWVFLFLFIVYLLRRILLQDELTDMPILDPLPFEFVRWIGDSSAVEMCSLCWKWHQFQVVWLVQRVRKHRSIHFRQFKQSNLTAEIPQGTIEQGGITWQWDNTSSHHRGQPASQAEAFPELTWTRIDQTVPNGNDGCAQQYSLWHRSRCCLCLLHFPWWRRFLMSLICCSWPSQGT